MDLWRPSLDDAFGRQGQGQEIDLHLVAHVARPTDRLRSGLRPSSGLLSYYYSVARCQSIDENDRVAFLLSEIWFTLEARCSSTERASR